jgi:hypothetical protein
MPLEGYVDEWLWVNHLASDGGRELNGHCCCSSWLLKMSLPFSHLVLFSSLLFPFLCN